MTDVPSPPDPQPQPDLVPLPGSTKPVVPGVPGTPTPRTEPAPDVEVTVVLRRRGGSGQPPSDAPPLAPADFAERYGADPTDLALAGEVFTRYGLRVVSSDAASRRLRLSGPVATMEAVFGTQLHTEELGGQRYRRRSGGLSVPRELAGVVVAVMGLDDTPQSRAHLRVVSPLAATVSYSPPQLATIYKFPDGTDGAGQTVAIIELGGGFAQSDLDTYFRGLGIPTPTVTAVGVDGASNEPGSDPGGADGEVLLDVEVVGALAPKAGIVVYFAPNTDDGFLDAIAQAAHATPTPTAMSISWGAYEDAWTEQSRTAMDDAFADAVALGVTVTAAAGDDGSTDRAADGGVHADFPASSPHVLGCGGTTLKADSAGTVTSERVWNGGTAGGATGGGVSKYFAVPDWQKSVGVPSTGNSDAQVGRGVPDVAAVADPATGYQIYVDGQAVVIGGTSAVAPLWAALVARLVQSLGRPLGLVQPRLYAGVAGGAVAAGFRDVTQGNNGAYQAGPGWDACTGLGVPVGTDLLTRLSGVGRQPGL